MMLPRLSTLVWSTLFVGLSWALFHVKYTVVELENKHRQLRRHILTKSEELHVMNAEWTFLNNPERLQKLAQKHLAHLHLEPIKGSQCVSFADVQKNGLDFYLSRVSSKIPAKTKKTSTQAPKAKPPYAQKVQQTRRQP